jgi:hypothetical protein
VAAELGLFGHLPARLGAPFTHFCAVQHLGVFPELPAIMRTDGANFSAGPAGAGVKARVPHHEAGTDATDVGAVDQETDVLRLRVTAAEFETAWYCKSAKLLAFATQFDARVHFGRAMLHVSHFEVPPCSGAEQEGRLVTSAAQNQP